MSITLVKTANGFQAQDDTGASIPLSGDPKYSDLVKNLSSGAQASVPGTANPPATVTAPTPTSPGSVVAAPGSTPAPPGGGGTAPAPSGSLDPLSAMNGAIAKMLSDAQGGQTSMDQAAQAGSNQIKTAAAATDASSTTAQGTPIAGLSPSQQDSVRSGEAGTFSTAGKNFNDQVSYFGKTLGDMEASLNAFGNLATVQLNATLTPQAIQGVLMAFAAGDATALSSLPASARASVFAAMAQNPQILQQYMANTKKGVLSGNAQTPVYDGNGNIIGYTAQVNDPSTFTQSLDAAKLQNQTPVGVTINLENSSGQITPVTGDKIKSSSSTGNFNTDLSSALSSAGISGGKAKQTVINGQEVIGSDGKMNPQAAMYMYENLLQQYPTKSANIKAAIKPYLNPKDYGPGGDPQLQNIFGVGN
jgi:hypothetical protein